MLHVDTQGKGVKSYSCYILASVWKDGATIS